MTTRRAPKKNSTYSKIFVTFFAISFLQNHIEINKVKYLAKEHKKATKTVLSVLP